MRLPGIVLLTLLFSASPVLAGEVYGKITDGRRPVPAGVKVEIAVQGKVYTTETDKFGSYRIVVREKGKCRFTVYLKDRSASKGLFSYDRSMRYDWVLETKDGTLLLRRK